MSAPATNAFSPAPVMTIDRTAASRCSASIARRSSSRVWPFNAFRTFGRFTVTTATAPSRSTIKFSK
jgi:hypothetical protein